MEEKTYHYAKFYPIPKKGLTDKQRHSNGHCVTVLGNKIEEFAELMWEVASYFVFNKDGELIMRLGKPIEPLDLIEKINSCLVVADIRRNSKPIGYTKDLRPEFSKILERPVFQGLFPNDEAKNSFVKEYYPVYHEEKGRFRIDYRIGRDLEILNKYKAQNISQSRSFYLFGKFLSILGYVPTYPQTRKILQTEEEYFRTIIRNAFNRWKTFIKNIEANDKYHRNRNKRKS